MYKPTAAREHRLGTDVKDVLHTISLQWFNFKSVANNMPHRLLQNTYSLLEIGKQDEKSVISVFNEISNSFYMGCLLINYFPVAQSPEASLQEIRDSYSTVIYLPKMKK